MPNTASDLADSTEPQDNPYTWADAIQDLALSTHLSVIEASALIVSFQTTDLDPDFVLPWVVRLVKAHRKEDYSLVGSYLAKMLMGERAV